MKREFFNTCEVGGALVVHAIGVGCGAEPNLQTYLADWCSEDYHVERYLGNDMGYEELNAFFARILRDAARDVGEGAVTIVVEIRSDSVYVDVLSHETQFSDELLLPDEEVYDEEDVTNNY